MHVRVKLQVDDQSESTLEIPWNLCETAGFKDGELVEINPFIRTLDGKLVEKTIIIRKVRQ